MNPKPKKGRNTWERRKAAKVARGADTYPITPKQVRFCQEIVKGATYSDAYRAAYNAEKMKQETVNREAFALFNNPKVATRIEELRKPVVEEAQLSAKMVLDAIMRLAVKTEAAERYSEALKAQELLGKHLAMFTDKTKVEGAIGVEVHTTVPLKVYGEDEDRL